MLNSFEFPAITRLAQRADVRLGKTLITAFEVIGKWDVLNAAFLMIGQHGIGYIVEGLAAPCADIKNTGLLRMIHEPEIYIHYIAHIDKVTPLFAIAVTFMAGKQIYK